jgi:hypothetical protein
VTLYQGPQAGPTGDASQPARDAAAEVEITWCSRHGLVTMHLVNNDGTERSRS